MTTVEAPLPERPVANGLLDTPTLIDTELLLPSGVIRGIAQGQQGYLWFATDGGLVVDVGAEDPLVVGTSTVHGGAPLPAAVTSVVAAPERGVWFADGHLKYATVWSDRIVDTGVPAHSVGRTGDDLWALEGSIARIVDGITYKVTGTVALDLHETGSQLRPTAVDTDGALYVGGPSEMVKVTPDGNITRFSVPGGVAGVATRRDGGVWFSSLSGLWSLGPESPRPVLATDPHVHMVDVVPTHAITELTDGRVLIGLGNGGVGVFDPTSGVWRDAHDSGLMTTSTVEQIFQDKVGRVWLALADATVKRFRDTDPYQAVDLPMHGARGAPTVRSMVYTDGSLWTALGPDGFARYEESSGTWSWPVEFRRDADHIVGTPNVTAVAWYNDELWIATAGQGLYRAPPTGGAAQHVESASAESITSLVATEIGLFFLSTVDHELHRIDENGNISQVLKSDPLSTPGAANTTTRDTLAPAQNLLKAIGAGDGSLFAADGRGLLEFDALTNRLIPVGLHDSAEWPTGTGAIFVESSNIVWLGSDVGVQRVDVRQGKVRHYVVHDGLPPGAVTTLMPHTDGRALWVGTTSGLAFIDLDSDEIVANLDRDHGLRSEHFVDATGATTRDGRAFVATTESIVELPSTRPDLHTDVEFQVRCSDGCESDANHHQVVRDPDHVTFEFISPDGERARNLPLEYRLTGHEDYWTLVTPDRRFASFSGLPPGSYAMEVRSVLGDYEPATASNDPRSSVRFQVTESWWRRQPVQLAFIASVIAVIWLGVVTYARRRRRQELLLEHTVAERTAELEQSRAHAELANHAKDRFLQAVTHDLRSPLGGVLGYVELIGNTPLDDKQRDYIDAIGRAGQSVVDLVEDLLFQSSTIVSRGQRAGEPAKLRDIVHQASQFAETYASTASIRIIEHADIDDTVIVDTRGLKHVLINLVTNAVKYSGGSEIVLEVQLGGYGHAARTGTYVFSVSDDGGRLSPDAVDQIFDAGFRGSPASACGSGIGLTMCREWVAANGGELQAKVDPGRYTTFAFSLTLPLEQRLDQPVSGGALDDENDSENWARQPLVLVVDDEAMVRGFLTAMLDQLGYRCCAYDNAVDALSYLAADACVLPDVIVSDFMMEPMSGEDFARQARDVLRSETPPIVAVTGVPAQASSTGLFDVVIGKPLRSRDLKDVLDGLAPITAPHEVGTEP